MLTEEDALADPPLDFQNEARAAGQLVALHRAADGLPLVVRHATFDPAATAHLSLFQAGTQCEIARIEVEPVAEVDSAPCRTLLDIVASVAHKRP